MTNLPAHVRIVPAADPDVGRRQVERTMLDLLRKRHPELTWTIVRETTAGGQA